MAINWTLSNHAISFERNVATASQAALRSGMGLAGILEASTSNLDINYPGMVGKVKYTDGTTTDVFNGIAIAPKKEFLIDTFIDQVVVPASPYVVLLSHTTSNTALIGAFDLATNAMVTVSSSAASSTNIQYGTDAATGLTSLTFDSTHVGVTFNITYQYTMTLTQESVKYGDSYPGWTQLEQLGRTGVISNGIVATNCFDPLANWSVANTPKVKCIANGLFTSADGGGASAAGFVPANVIVTAVPTFLVPWLVLELI